MGPIGEDAHDRIGNSIKHAQRKEQSTDQRRGEPKDVSIEKSEKVHDQAGDDRSTGVAQTIAYFFTER